MEKREVLEKQPPAWLRAGGEEGEARLALTVPQRVRVPTSKGDSTFFSR